MIKNYWWLLLITLVFGSCGNKKSENESLLLNPSGFLNKIKEKSDAIILDVRTSGEFREGHIENAQNFDIQSGDFLQKIAQLDKSKPIFVYCLSGGRSASAADEMRASGFKEVYELDGGMMKWRAAGMDEVKGENTEVQATGGMTKEMFENLLNTDKIVLVDFYADWCAPCQKMKPYIDEISSSMSQKVTVIRINADEHPAICQQLAVDALPTLKIFKNKALVWNSVGLVEKEEVLKQLN